MRTSGTIGMGRHGRSAIPCLLALLGAGILACGEASRKDAEMQPGETNVVLARIGSEVVTAGDLGFVPPNADAAVRLDAVIRRKLAISEARRRGLENDPKVRSKIEEIHHNAERQVDGLLRNALYNLIRLGMEVSEADLQALYEETKDRYVEPQWALRMQDFPNEDAGLAAMAELGPNGRLDPAQSQAPGLLPTTKLPKGVLKSLGKLQQPGDHLLVPLDRWTIVELEEYQPAAQLPFESVREKVDSSLRATRAEELMRAEIDRLMVEAKVSVDEAALAAVVAQQAEIRAAAGASSP